MIGYVTLGSNDLPRAWAFYDALMAVVGGKRFFGDERFQTFGMESPCLGVCRPFNDQAASAGNGTMVALRMPGRAAVDRLYGKALALGGADEGAPGIRGDEESDFYAAYFRDLDGNKLCAFHTDSME